MENKVITTRNYFEALITLATKGQLVFTNAEGEEIEIVAEDLKTWAEKNIAQLDRRNETARARAEKKRVEGDALMELVYEALTDEFATIADITARVDAEDVTVAKTQFRLKALFDAGRIEKGTVTIPGGEGQRARALVAYKRV